MRACVSAGRKGIKKGGCAARRRKKVILKKKREKKYRGATCFGFWTMIQKQRPIRPSCFPIITRIQYPPCIRKISFSLFFSREVQGDVVTSLMLVPAVLRFSFSFPISFHFLLASLAAPGALPAVLRQPAFSEELQPIMHLCFG